ncbi:probable Delta(3,5)-Delta(2,4)-dienoyl-CoA isomerase, mitochondrial precursor [Phialocephala subalpina]|uniref:Probable Delta(3,5)-Delta(2,4)-dienoyl-CoA isomerase, mitochondrial n=1 Tax=Phialocephala subalpina TaxID=576137 RepID=A0A1L7WJK8_9HELO|nr:probable Delta(3,5)-Delta(2,4)-dienoyl-CoA isomerase, mitochondrial precursor [Phialocephala subalpina]
MATPSYKHFLVHHPLPFVAHVEINRPQKLNAFYEEMWLEFKTVFDTLSHSPDVRAIILSGAGDRAFTAGLDVEAASQSGILVQASGEADVARKAVQIKRHVEEFQNCVGSVEKCEKPVICVLHGFAFGLALDISTCADIRIASADVKLAVKEVDIGLAADIGTLSRLPKLVGNFGWVKDVALSARVFGAEEAYRVGFVSQVHENKQKAIEAALEMAELLATKSPVAVQGTKELLNHARDHTLLDSLRYTGVWNSAAIQTSDVERAMLSGLKKRKPTFEKL